MDGSLTIGSENSEECATFTPAISYKVDKKFSLKGSSKIEQIKNNENWQKICYFTLIINSQNVRNVNVKVSPVSTPSP